VRAKINRNISNIPGWRTSRKIIVIESDDWGSIRMPSNKAFNLLVEKKIIPRSGIPFNEYDTLATPEDLGALFETLYSFSDIYSNPCVVTAVCNVANPDFQRIKESGFREYFFEPFTDTLTRYYNNGKSFEMWKEGIENRIFVPQFHGREHLNVGEWMRALQNNDRKTQYCFENGFWAIPGRSIGRQQIYYQAAFDFHDPADLPIHIRAIKEGLELFKKLFGYNALFFVPPNGPFNNSLEEVAADSGIRYVAASKIQTEPLGLGKSRKVFHWLGQQNRIGQLYTIRNCHFEPIEKSKDWVDSCLSDINIAFRWHKPAIISTHRANYIGALNPKNRDNGLGRLKILLQSVKKRWPEVEFMTSDQLGSLILSTKNGQ